MMSTEKHQVAGQRTAGCPPLGGAGSALPLTGCCSASSAAADASAARRTAAVNGSSALLLLLVPVCAGMRILLGLVLVGVEQHYKLVEVELR